MRIKEAFTPIMLRMVKVGHCWPPANSVPPVHIGRYRLWPMSSSLGIHQVVRICTVRLSVRQVADRSTSVRSGVGLDGLLRSFVRFCSVSLDEEQCTAGVQPVYGGPALTVLVGFRQAFTRNGRHVQ